MKISYRDYRGEVEFKNIEEAVKDALVPEAYNYNGQLEGIKAENEKLKEIISRLVKQRKRGKLKAYLKKRKAR